MDLELLGWPAAGPTLDLDHRRFAYAGKFVVSTTGKAVVRADGAVVAAVAFDEDRSDGALRLRYVTVRDDRRGEGLGPRLCAFVARRAADRGYDVVRIAVNNPFAYEALYRAGFGYIAETTGIAELVLERPPPADRDPQRYRAGLDVFRERDLSEAEEAFLEERREATPPPPVAEPSG